MIFFIHKEIHEFPPELYSLINLIIYGLPDNVEYTY